MAIASGAMKKFHALLCAVAISLASCASVDWSNPEAARPLATVATAAYLNQDGNDYIERVSREVKMRTAAQKLREVALAENPTADAAAVALEAVDIDPAYRAAAASIIRLYAPRLNAQTEDQARVTLVNIADGIEDALPKLSGK